MAHQELGMQLLIKVKEETGTIAKVELEPKLEGRQMIDGTRSPVVSRRMGSAQVICRLACSQGIGCLGGDVSSTSMKPKIQRWLKSVLSLAGSIRPMYHKDGMGALRPLKLSAKPNYTKMTIKITGKNVDLGDSLRSYALDRVETALGKFSGRPVSGQISVEKIHDGFSTQCAIHLETGLDMQSAGKAPTPMAVSIPAMERLEKRLRRYKRRLKSHGQGTVNPAQLLDSAGIDYVIDVERTAESPGEEGDGAGAPAVIAEKPARIRAMAVATLLCRWTLPTSLFWCSVTLRTAGSTSCTGVQTETSGGSTPAAVPETPSLCCAGRNRGR